MDFTVTWDTGATYDLTSQSSWSTSPNSAGSISVDSNGVVSGQAPGTVGVAVEDSSEPVYSTICIPLPADNPCPVTFGAPGGASGTVYDATPVITGISPAVLDAGTTTQLILTGSGFGTNAPTLTLSPSSSISYSLTSYNDTEILAQVSVAANTPTETLNVSVTSNGYSGQGFTGGSGQNSAKSSPSSIQVQAPNAPRVTISIAFTGSKSPGDNLSFTASTTDCSNSLGLQNCPSPSPGSWEWNIEGKGVVTDDASKWTVQQSKVSGQIKGFYKTSTGYLVSFSSSIAAGSDGPASAFLQQTAGQTSIYWIDGPGNLHTYSGNLIDSMTEVQNFSTQFCSTTSAGDCKRITWFVKVVVKPGAQLDTTNSKAGYGSTSTTF